MSDYELIKALNDLSAEVRTLRHEVMMLQSARRDEQLNGRFLTMDEACALLKVSRTTMYRRMAEGALGFAVKRGKSWLFPSEKLKAYASGLI